MVIYVDKEGNAAFFYRAKMKVGPCISSDYLGNLYFTMGMTEKEIAEMAPIKYQQLQITGEN